MASERPRGYAAIGLHHAKTPANIGAVLRAAGVFGVSLVALSGTRYSHRASTDTLKAWRHLPLIHCDDLHAVVPYACVPVAVELREDGRSLVSYVHPERAFYVFGPEDGSLSSDVLAWCRDVVQIPTPFSLNLAHAVNVVLYDRLAKQERGDGV